MLIHCCTSDILPVDTTMGTEKITLISFTCFQKFYPVGSMNVTFVLRQVCCSHLNTEIHTFLHSHYEKGTPCVSVAPGFCFLHGLWWQWVFLLSCTHVKRWYVWILNRMPQRIPNWEHGVVMVGRSLFLLPVVPRGVFATRPPQPENR